MNIIRSLFSLIGLLIIAIVVCFIFCNVQFGTHGYDIFVSRKVEEPRWFVGIRHREDFMIHVFKKKTLGDNIGSMIDEWQTKQQETQQ